MKEIRHVVLHTPGPAWQRGVPAFEQAGLEQHVAHYAAWLAEGKLLLGGPFVDAASGGMMVAEPGVDAAELGRHAAADPAVRSGLLTFEVRPWLIGLRR